MWKERNPFTAIIPGSDAVKLYSNILCLITMYIWCLNSFFLCDDETTQVSPTSFFILLGFFSLQMFFFSFFFFLRVWRHLFRAFSLAPSICIALGLFSYDCKNESSSHQLKCFIFTALSASWLSLLAISASLFVTYTHTAHTSLQQTPDWGCSFCLWKVHILQRLLIIYFVHSFDRKNSLQSLTEASDVLEIYMRNSDKKNKLCSYQVVLYCFIVLLSFFLFSLYLLRTTCLHKPQDHLKQQFIPQGLFPRDCKIESSSHKLK